MTPPEWRPLRDPLLPPGVAPAGRFIVRLNNPLFTLSTRLRHSPPRGWRRSVVMGEKRGSGAGLARRLAVSDGDPLRRRPSRRAEQGLPSPRHVPAADRDGSRLGG